MQIIKNTKLKFSIYGTNWEHYPKFREHYKGYISSPHEINKAIQESKVMVHDNHNLHFRVLDAMINGTPVAMGVPRKVNDNLELFGLIKGIHYLQIDIFKQENFKLPSDKQLKTNTVSEITKHGRHTTTAATLYHLPDGGDLIDSPGVAIFGLADLTEQQLAWGYREFQPLIEQCRFKDCRHVNDKGCAVRPAAENGDIPMQRYQRYLKLREKMPTAN